MSFSVKCIYFLAVLLKHFEPGQFRSLRQTVVFRDDFNGHLNKGHYTTDVSAWGGGVGDSKLVCYLLYPGNTSLSASS